MKLSKEDQAQIAQAIAAAEASTSGEIFCVLARSASSYFDVSLAWAAGFAFIAPASFLALRLPPFFAGSDVWQAAHSNPRLGFELGGYLLIQALVFFSVLALSRTPVLLRNLTPSGLRRTRVRQAAISQFLAHGVHATPSRTGVLIFAALDDHRVELIADEAIHSRVDPTEWAKVVGGLTTALKAGQPVEGFILAIQRAGSVLTEHFPPHGEPLNELPDHLIIL